MESRAYALIVGIFTLLVGGAVVFVLWWWTAGSGNTKEYVLVTPKSVSGLARQAVVRFRGIRVGKVTSVKIDGNNPQQILVRIEVNDETPITQATRARIAFQGISGLGHVQLDDDGRDPRPLLAQGDDPPRIPMQGGLMDQINEGAPEILARLRTATEGINRLMSPQNIDRIEATLENLAKSSAHFERTMAQTPALMADIRRYSAPENAEHLRQTLANLQQITAQIKPAIDNFNRTLGRVEAAGSRIDRVGADIQQGVTGDTLPRVNALIDELHVTTTRLNRVLEDIERTPQVLVTGRERLQPGPGEQIQVAP